ncbi:hypothetical protein ACXR6G_07865 [Ancylomarina sp. YFZ004]
MKKILLLMLFALSVQIGFSQDIIVQRNGEEIKSKIIEITNETLKYKKFENQEGPTRNIDLPKVFMVIYENGEREKFTSSETEVENTVTEKSVTNNASVSEKEIIRLNSNYSGKGFTPPSEGKAVVYFTRISSWGGAYSFEYFHQDKYMGVFKGKNYMRYECDPGKQLFWASSENKEFITTDLEAGGTYIVIVDIIMGAWKSRVGFTPITADDTEKFDRAVALINKKKAIVTPATKINKMNNKLKKFIGEKLQTYNNVWKNEKNFKHISADMAIPTELLK